MSRDETAGQQHDTPGTLFLLDEQDLNGDAQSGLDILLDHGDGKQGVSEDESVQGPAGVGTVGAVGFEAGPLGWEQLDPAAVVEFVEEYERVAGASLREGGVDGVADLRGRRPDENLSDGVWRDQGAEA